MKTGDQSEKEPEEAETKDETKVVTPPAPPTTKAEPSQDTTPLTAAEQRKLLAIVSEIKEWGAKSHKEIMDRIEVKYGEETAKAADKAVKEIDKRGLRHLLSWWPW